MSELPLGIAPSKHSLGRKMSCSFAAPLRK